MDARPFPRAGASPGRTVPSGRLTLPRAAARHNKATHRRACGVAPAVTSHGDTAMKRLLLGSAALLIALNLSLRTRWADAGDKKEGEKGWTQLFNGKDLT